MLRRQLGRLGTRRANGLAGVGGIGVGAIYASFKVGMIYELETLELEREFDCSYGVADLRTPDEVASFYQSLLVEGSAGGFVECAEAFRSFHMVDEAFASYGAAIARDPGLLAAYLGRGEFYFEQAILANTGDEVQAQALLAVADFRKAMLASLGSTEVVWKLGIALLIVGDDGGAQGLAENVLTKSKVISDVVRRDFLYLLGFAKLFSGDCVGAGVAAEELVHMEGDLGEGSFMKRVISIVSGEVEAATDCGRSGLADSALLEAGEHLQVSGCREFLDVARALVGLRMERKV